ncbi:hypothetical protein F53441_11622 [Fusarium austroafricanum]|uniref:beta-glucosidase n=1 Tax=Fusarium austroafricanum TaxID=2364996 RepID=A0A8H4NZ35_9HYPO|nr:hypothetical protein F53441_11622 [Fusarium austroafricanum]
MWSSLLLLGGVSLSIANPIVRQDPNPPYRNKTLCLDKRVDDLMSRMSLEDKAGQMFHGRTVVVNNTFDATIEGFVTGKRITHYVLSGGVNDVRGVANWYNKLQQLALSMPLGIPITISSDPQHGWTDENAVSVVAHSFSRWTEPLGLAALRNPELVRQFAEIAREEYVAVGIRQALHPQVDLATEPRWGRISGTMGEDANLTSALMVEYIKGLQGDKIGPNSGKNQTYPGDNRDYHLIPFKAAIKAGTRQMMPYYSRPINTSWEEVAFGFNKGVVNDLLKKELGFDGIVVTDWGIVTDRAWGLEDKTELERARRVLEAGCDIFGGETKPELIIELVKKGLIPESRIDESVRKLMKEKFELGLFDNPFVDVEKAARIAGNDYFSRLGNETQRRAFTLLSNKDDTLPLPLSALKAKFYIEGIEPEVMESRNLSVVEKPEDADYAFLRLASPFKPTTAPGLPSMINNGSIEFNATEKARQAKIYATLPTVVDIRLNRPAAVPEVAEKAVALFGSYGSSHDAFLDVVFGTDGWSPEGRLPFDLPASQAAADAQKEDVPFDVEALFKFGHGLRYKDTCESS